MLTWHELDYWSHTLAGESSAILTFSFFFDNFFFFSIFGPCIEHGPTKIQTLLLDIDESWCHFVLIFSFFFRNYNPEGRKKPVSREEAMEELIDVVINATELKSWVITGLKFSFPSLILSTSIIIYKIYKRSDSKYTLCNTLFLTPPFLLLVKIYQKLESHEWNSLNKEWDLCDFIISNKLIINSVFKRIHCEHFSNL